MKRIAAVVTAGLLAAAMVRAETAQRATVILGAGLAGSWDTRISITNVDFNPMTVVVTTQLDRAGCAATPCHDLAQAVIPGHGTFVLSSFPDPGPPQAVYVLSPGDQKAPAVSAVAFDTSSSCGRMTTLQALPFDVAFNYGDVFFPGVSRGGGRYANLMLTLDPAATDHKLIGVGVADAGGNLVWAGQFELAPGESRMLVDVLATLGVESLDGGTIWLSRFFVPNSYDFTRYTATVTMVEPDRVSTVTGTVDPRLTDGSK